MDGKKQGSLGIVALAILVAALALACAPAGPRGPSTLIYHQAFWDTNLKVLAIALGQRDQGSFPNEVWTYDPKKRQWAELPPEPALEKCHTCLAFDPAAGLAVVYVDSRWNNFSTMDVDQLNDTWTLDLRTKAFRKLVTQGSPPPGMLGSNLVYDPADDRFILFGGYNTDTGQYFGETWIFDLGALTWTRLSPKVSPPPRNFSQAVWDSRVDKLVLTGGDSGGNEDPRTWLFDYATGEWTGVETAEGPGQACYAGLAFVPELGGTLQFGGVVGGKEKPNNDTWLFDATALAWKKLSPPDAPTYRGWLTLTWDDMDKRLWLYGGGAKRTLPTDEFWYFDPAKTTWTRMERPKK